MRHWLLLSSRLKLAIVPFNDLEQLSLVDHAGIEGIVEGAFKAARLLDWDQNANRFDAMLNGEGLKRLLASSDVVQQLTHLQPQSSPSTAS